MKVHPKKAWKIIEDLNKRVNEQKYKVAQIKLQKDDRKVNT